MENSPAFQLYAQDFLTGVMYLTNEEIGIYIKMLCKQWTDERIPKKRLGFLTGKDWDSMSEELRSKFVDMGDYLVNTRLEGEREKKVAFKKKQSENGKKGGRPTKKEEVIKPKQKPNDIQKKPLEDEDEERRVKSEKEIENENVVEVEIYPAFSDFWDLYDKKTGSPKKLKPKWDKLAHTTKENIMAYIPSYKQAQPDKYFRKNPETFLNNESWNDEIIQTSNGNTSETRTNEEIFNDAYNSDMAKDFRFS